jgi:hypothetical protein
LLVLPCRYKETDVDCFIRPARNLERFLDQFTNRLEALLLPAGSLCQALAGGQEQSLQTVVGKHKRKSL